MRPSAPAAIRKRSWRRPAPASSASIAIRARSPKAPAWSRRPKAGSIWSRTASPIWKPSSAAAAAVDGIVFDVGVSSMQIDDAARGFSFRLDGPLDMRMGRDGPSAADIVARASERELGLIIATLGEERHARAVARAIVKARGERAIDTTRALAEIVARVVHSRDSAIHPATRTFQALADFRQRRARRIGARPRRGRAGAQTVRPPGRGRLPFARGSHRQNLPHRTQPRAGRLAASAGTGGGGAELCAC